MQYLMTCAAGAGSDRPMLESSIAGVITLDPDLWIEASDESGDLTRYAAWAWLTRPKGAA